MRDEEIQQLVQDEEELESYIQQNPHDEKALLFGAFFEARKKWQQEVSELTEDLFRLRLDIAEYERQIANIPKWKNIWRRIFKTGATIEELRLRVSMMEQYEKELDQRFLHMANSAPEDWRYKLAMLGNNLFTAR